jgi:hypothetical protein
MKFSFPVVDEPQHGQDRAASRQSQFLIELLDDVRALFSSALDSCAGAQRGRSASIFRTTIQKAAAA